jgi:hypothetical protein
MNKFFFEPIRQMLDRLKKSKQDSDASYFFDLLLLGEQVTKIVTASMVAGIEDDKERHRYRQLHRLVRADGIGEWSATLDEVLSGVSSQYLQKSIRDNEQKELQTKVKAGNWQFDCIQQLTSVFPLLELGQVELPDRVQGKMWFSYFAQLRNGTKGHGAQLPHQISNVCSILFNSITHIIENLFLFQREWAYLYQNLNGKYRVTNLNHNITAFQTLKTTHKHDEELSNGVYVLFDKKTKVELITSDPDASDFYLPNGNFKDKIYEVLSFVSNKRLFPDNTAYLTPASSLPESETQGLQSLNLQHNCFGNMPLLSSDYIRRYTLEDDLKFVLDQNDRYPIITLRGTGGIGKTTLAISVIQELSQSNRFDLILWFSSRDIDLTLDGPKPVKNSILNERDLANEFVNLLEIKDLSRSSEKVEYFSKQLSHCDFGTTLFVFDNFETVSNPSELFKWLDTFVRNPNKILITSRISKSFKADYPIEIEGMSHSECKELIARTAESLQISDILSNHLEERIIEESQGHPYVIKILLGQIAKNPKMLQVERIMASQEDILIALFRRTYTTLTPAAKRIFLTLCSWRSIVPEIALEAVLLRSDIQERIDVGETVEELRKSSFIDVITSKVDFSTFLSVPLAAFLFGKSELEVSPMKIAILSDRELLQEFGTTQQFDIRHGIFPRIERKFRSIAKRISSGSESLDSQLQLLQFLCHKYPFGWRLLSQLALENDNLELAAESLREFLKTSRDVEDRKLTLFQLASIYATMENWFAEVNTLTEVCLLPNATIEDISETANTINRYVFKDEHHAPKLILDNEIKQSLIRKVAEVMANKIERTSFVTATDYSRLAWLYMHLQENGQATEAVEKGLSKDYSNIYCQRLANRLGLQ